MKEVFEAHPNVDKIFLVEGMPFFKYNEALNYAGGFTDKVQIYTRLQAEQAEAGSEDTGGEELTEERKALIEHAEKLKAEAKEKAEAEAAVAKAEAEKAVAAKIKK